MNLIETIKNNEKPQQPVRDEVIENLFDDFGFGYYCEEFQPIDLKQRPIITWICTDTQVGVYGLYLNNIAVGYYEMTGRKANPRVFFLGDESFFDVYDYFASIKRNNALYSLVSVDEEAFNLNRHIDASAGTLKVHFPTTVLIFNEHSLEGTVALFENYYGVTNTEVSNAVIYLDKDKLPEPFDFDGEITLFGNVPDTDDIKEVIIFLRGFDDVDTLRNWLKENKVETIFEWEIGV